MVVRNVVRSPVRAVVQSVFGEGESFHPFQLFRSGAQGAWYDPSDFSTLYQDAAGTTPVTAVEQPVRLMLDRSRGLVLGSELWTAFGTITAPWTSVGGGVFSIDGSQAGNCDLSQSSQYVSGKFYVTTFTLSGVTGGTITVFAGEGNGVAYGNGAHTIRSSASQAYLIFRAPAGVAATVSAVSVRELPGNHAVAPNDASRPVLRSRYNLLTRSEEFDDGAWTKTRVSISANSVVAPDGTTTADKLVENGDNNTHQINQGVTTTASSHTFSVYLKALERDWSALAFADNGGTDRLAYFDLSTGTVGTLGTGVTASISYVGNGWYQCAMTLGTAFDGANRVRIYTATADNTIFYQGDGTSGILIWGAQLLTAADHAATGGAYQRVGAATDYDTGPPWRPYLAFDGSDDSMSTSSIDFSGTDKMTVFAGVSKLSDAVQGIVAELSADVDANNGSFRFTACNTNTVADLGFRARGTTSRQAVSAASFPSPRTSVLRGFANISGDVVQLLENGTQIASSSADLGTGNFGNYPLFIGRRNNTSSPFNGRLYSLAVLGRTATAPELTAMESWIAGKTGVSL